MTPEQFMECFGVVAEAEGGIDKLRTLIMALAIRGKLVEQQDNEGSGDDALLAEGEIVDSGEFEVPSQWRWATLPAIASLEIGRTPSTKEPKYWDTHGIAWVSIGDMIHLGIVTNTQRRVTSYAAEGPLSGKLGACRL